MSAPSIWAWSQTASTNATADSDQSWAENMAPKLINDNLRVLMKRVADFLQDLGGTQKTTGSANVYALTLNDNFAAYKNGMIVTFQVNATNTATATIQVSSASYSGAAKALLRADRAVVNPGDLQLNAYYMAVYDSSANSGAGAWVVLNLMPTATIYFHSGTEAFPSMVSVDYPQTGFYWIDENNVGLSMKGVEGFRFYSSGAAQPVSRLGIGLKAPTANLHILSQSGIANYTSEQYGNTNIFSFDSAGGTILIPSISVIGDTLGRIRWRGLDNGATPAFAEAARIACLVDQAVGGTGKVPGRIVFSTTTSGGTLTEALRIDSFQHLIFNGDTGTWLYQSSAGANTLSLALNSYEAWRWTTTGVGFRSGTGTPVSPIATFYAQQTTGPFLYCETYSITPNVSPIIKLARSHNASLGGNTIVAQDDSLGQIIFSANSGGSAFGTSAKIEALADAIGAGGGSSNAATRLVISTSTNASPPVLTEAIRIDSNQRISFKGDTNSYIGNPAGNNTFSIGLNSYETWRFTTGGVSFRQTAGTAVNPPSAYYAQQTQGAGLYVETYNVSAGISAAIKLMRSHNAAVGTYTLVSLNDSLGQIIWSATDGSGAWGNAARLEVFAEAAGTANGTNAATRMVFSTSTAAGTPVITEALRIDSSQHICFNGDTGTYLYQNSGNNTLSLNLNNYEAFRCTVNGISFLQTGGTAVDPAASFYSRQSRPQAFYAESYTTTIGNSPTVKLMRARSSAIGTAGTVLANDSLGQIVFSASDGAGAFGSSARIEVIAEANGTANGTNAATRMVFSTSTAAGTPVNTEAIRIDSAQHLCFAGDVNTYLYQSGTVNTLSIGLAGYEAYRFTTSGIGFRSGTGTPVTPVSTFYSQQTTQAFAYCEVYTTTVGNSAIIKLCRSHNAALGGNTQVVVNDSLGQLIFSANDGSGGWGNSAKIEVLADANGTGTGTNAQTRMVFSTSNGSPPALTEALRIDSNQHLCLAGDTSCFLYQNGVAGTISFGVTGGESIRLSSTGIGFRSGGAGTVVTPAAPFHSQGLVGLHAQLESYSSNTGTSANIRFCRSKNGTLGGHTALAANDSIGSLVFCVSDGTSAFPTVCRIETEADALGGASGAPTRLKFSVMNAAMSNVTEALRIDMNGCVWLPANSTINPQTTTFKPNAGGLAVITGNMPNGVAPNGQADDFLLGGTGNQGMTIATESATGNITINFERSTAANSNNAAGQIKYANNTTTGTLTLNSEGDINLSPGASNDCNLSSVNLLTTATAANVAVDAGGRLRKVSSSRRFKRDIRPLTPDDLDRFALLTPVKFRSAIADCDQNREHHGFLAEEVDAAGLKALVGYDEEGRPSSLAYGAFTAALLGLVQRERKLRQALEQRLDDLLGRLERGLGLKLSPQS